MEAQGNSRTQDRRLKLLPRSAPRSRNALFRAERAFEALSSRKEASVPALGASRDDRPRCGLLPSFEFFIFLDRLLPEGPAEPCDAGCGRCRDHEEEPSSQYGLPQPSKFAEGLREP